jgi:hypothetical protein
MKEVTCPSRAILKVNLAPFKDAKALYQSVLKEARGVSMESGTEMAVVVKDMICAGFSSLEVERCLWECLKRCTYDSGKGDLKIDDGTFEPEASRDDYIFVCVEVAKENIFPFVKSLYAEYQRYLSMTESTQK